MPRESPFTFAFSSPHEAVEALCAGVEPVGVESVPLAVCAGRILAAPIVADRRSPPADVSSMDGYAVRIADCTRSELPIAGEVRIGHAPAPLPPGACFRIVTGAPVPPGADAVIKREDVAEHSDRIVLSGVHPAAGQYIRRAGENLQAGAEVVPAGSFVTPPISAALAAFGVVRPDVHRRVRVAILTTGDEIVPVEAQPDAYQLRNSNAGALVGLLVRLPFVDVRHVHVPDDQGAMKDAVARELKAADALLLTGGVSMGHRDFAADAVAATGARVLFHGLPQRPGKPILGAILEGRPILALPGNPVSVMVTARRIALPALLTLSGAGKAAKASLFQPALVRLVNLPSSDRPIDLWWHRLVRLLGPGEAELIDARSSGDIVGAARADGFVEMPARESGPGPWPFYRWGM